MDRVRFSRLAAMAFVLGTMPAISAQTPCVQGSVTIVATKS
jgi:hypothetical protein